MEVTDSLGEKTVQRLRKPEARSAFTHEVLSGFHEYFVDLINQSNPPEIIRKFNKGQGVVFPLGSVLRGTARVGSDLDTAVVYDSTNLDNGETIGRFDLEITFCEPEQYHPSGKAFGIWLADRVQSSASTAHFYEDRRKLLQWEIDQSNNYRQRHNMALRTFNETDVSPRFMGVEAESFDIEALAIGIRNLEHIDVKDLEVTSERRVLMEYLGILLPSLLTVTDDYVISSVEGSIKRHQQKIVSALAELEKGNPTIFNEVYKIIEDEFSASIAWNSSNHPHAESLGNLDKEYIKQSGRFTEDKIDRAAKLLRVIKKQVTLPKFQYFKEKFLAT